MIFGLKVRKCWFGWALFPTQYYGFLHNLRMSVLLTTPRFCPKIAWAHAVCAEYAAILSSIAGTRFDTLLAAVSSFVRGVPMHCRVACLDPATFSSQRVSGGWCERRRMQAQVPNHLRRRRRGIFLCGAAPRPPSPSVPPLSWARASLLPCRRTMRSASSAVVVALSGSGGESVPATPMAGALRA